MGARRPETLVKRAREQALREKRERKQAKKDARAAERLAGPVDETVELDENGEPIESDELEPEGDEPEVEAAP
jgi:hypothetical protein